jgi:hypothetical protein
MSAQTILKQAANCGVQLTLDGDRMAFKATIKPPADLLAAIREHKAAIAALLRSDPAPEPDQAEPHAASIAAETAAMDAVESEFQKELALLREANTRVSSRRYRKLIQNRALSKLTELSAEPFRTLVEPSRACA